MQRKGSSKSGREAADADALEDDAKAGETASNLGRGVAGFFLLAMMLMALMLHRQGYSPQFTSAAEPANADVSFGKASAALPSSSGGGGGSLRGGAEAPLPSPPLVASEPVPLQPPAPLPAPPRALGVETLKLRSGLAMPALGYGTCCRATAKGAALEQSTARYLGAGGRLVDTAMAYRNHREIGRALRASGVDRATVWLTSKISPNMAKSRAACVAAGHAILAELGVEYLDLLLIHTPKLGRAATLELWKGLIDLKASGKVRAIGVSNMNALEIADLVDATGEAPEVNQIQFHPWTPVEWRDVAANLARDYGVVTTAYTSLGGARFRAAGSHWGPTLTAVAKKHGVTEAQVLLRWSVQQGVAVIPGSASEAHIRENLLLRGDGGSSSSSSSPVALVLDAEDLDALAGAPAPQAWFDPKRGPAKIPGKEALVAWGGS